MGAGRRKTFVFGVDGGTLSLVRPWAAAGELPNLARLLSEGAWGVLNSCFPPITPQAWSCFMTGKNAGKHGLFHFIERLPNSYEVRYVNARVRAGATIQQILSRRGLRVGLLNVPMTFPPEAVNGFEVSGLDAPSLGSDFTWPPSLKDELSRAVGQYVIDLRLKGSMTDARRPQVIEDLKRMEEVRKRALFHLWGQGDYDYLMHVAISTDRVQHHFWKFHDPAHEDYDPAAPLALREAILAIYRHVDGVLGEVMARLPEDTDLVVMSDHGSGPATSLVFYPNKWLQELGWQRLRGGGRQRGLAFTAVRGLKRALIRTLPQWGKERLLEHSGLRARVQSYLLLSRIDWPHTLAFSDEMMDGIWLNVKGREPEGIVEPGADYERRRAELMERLTSLVDPQTGRRVIEAVYRREDLFHGPYAWKAPDVLFHFRDYRYRIRPSDTTAQDSRQGVFGQVRSESRTSGSHRKEGLFILWGRNFRRGVELPPAEIVDIAPTILHNMGLPVPSDMDGRVLEEAFVERAPVRREEVGETSLVEAESTYTPEEAAEVERRLRGIGYIE